MVSVDALACATDYTNPSKWKFLLVISSCRFYNLLWQTHQGTKQWDELDFSFFPYPTCWAGHESLKYLFWNDRLHFNNHFISYRRISTSIYKVQKKLLLLLKCEITIILHTTKEQDENLFMLYNSLILLVFY